MDLVPARFRDCACPGTPHLEEGDVAFLRPYLDYAGGAEALAVMMSLGDDLTDTIKLGPLLGPVFIRRGVVAWNLVDENGPVPVTPERLDALRWEDAYELGDKADDLYGAQVLAPLVRRMNASSRNGLTVVSTQPPAKRSSKRQKRSASSS